MKYVQIIKVIEIRPDITCSDQTVCIDKDCTTSVNIPLRATDNCSDEIRFRVDITKPDGSHDKRSDITAIPEVISLQVYTKSRLLQKINVVMKILVV
jgi:hypothetical protein